MLINNFDQECLSVLLIKDVEQGLLIKDVDQEC
jgi:hypothetical protein